MTPFRSEAGTCPQVMKILVELALRPWRDTGAALGAMKKDKMVSKSVPNNFKPIMPNTSLRSTWSMNKRIELTVLVCDDKDRCTNDSIALACGGNHSNRVVRVFLKTRQCSLIVRRINNLRLCKVTRDFIVANCVTQNDTILT